MPAALTDSDLLDLLGRGRPGKLRLSQLVPWDSNPREHEEGQVEALAHSIRMHGYIRPIMLQEGSNRIVAGHGTRLALLLLAAGMDPEVPVVFATLSDTEAKSYAVADNRLTDLSTWNIPTLKSIMAELNLADWDLTATGFTEEAMNDMFGVGGAGEPGPGAAETEGLVQRFGAPPFSMLDPNQSYWQARMNQWLDAGCFTLWDARGADWGTRKDAWVALGLKSEDGRADNLTFAKSAQSTNVYNLRNEMRAAAGGVDPEWDAIIAEAERRGMKIAEGTSIFDPVLCELLYSWFCPMGGAILDPFSGGSVRGVVAAALGRTYAGVDLRSEQVDANRFQWAHISGADPSLVPVKVSAKMARLMFHPCVPEYIESTCHGRCCDSSTSPTGTVITIHPAEEAGIVELGGVVKDHMLQPKPGCKVCPFKGETGLCGIHFSGKKPFGCIASPFTLNPNGTLIVRNRYRLLGCYQPDEPGSLPAYVNFRASLDLIFGAQEAARICGLLDQGEGDVTGYMPRASYDTLRDNDAAKHGEAPDPAVVSDLTEPAVAYLDWPAPNWIHGDSQNILTLAPGEYDFVMSCPPYGDLEVYSEQPEDLSNMGHDAFMDAYRRIIKDSCAMLKPDRFAAWVIGDFRDAAGNYRNFVSETIDAFLAAGLTLYNEAILITPLASLPIRAGRQFAGSRKLGKGHQNILVFLKGDSKKAVEALGTVQVMNPFTQFAAVRANK